MLGYECSETGFDAAAKLPGEEAEKLGGGTKNTGNNKVCEANPYAISNVFNVVFNEFSNEIKGAGESSGTPQQLAETRQDEQPGLRLQEVGYPPLGHRLGG